MRDELGVMEGERMKDELGGMKVDREAIFNLLRIPTS